MHGYGSNVPDILKTMVRNNQLIRANVRDQTARYKTSDKLLVNGENRRDTIGKCDILRQGSNSDYIICPNLYERNCSIEEKTQNPLQKEITNLWNLL